MANFFSQIRFYLLHPFLVLDCVLSKVLYPLILLRSKGFKKEGKLILKGLPKIVTKNGGVIKIKDNVTLNSRKLQYHVNMHSSVKLIVVKPGAKLEIGANTRINGACIHASEKIVIGDNCLIAANTQIFDNSGHEACISGVEERIHTSGSSAPIVIGDNVWIGINCIVLPGVSIGNDSVIGAGSVVTKDIPGNVLVAGNPAKIIKYYSDETKD